MSRLFAPAGERGKLNLKFENKTALVSASTAGIGFAIALELAREGARVFVNGRTQARVQAAIVNIRHEIYESQVEGIAEDLAALAGAENLLRRLPAKFGWVSEGIVLQNLLHKEDVQCLSFKQFRDSLYSF